MDRVAIAGLSLHHADLADVEHVQRAVARRDQPAAQALADRLGASEAVCLSTCNRFEVVYARENGHAPASEDLALLAEEFELGPGDERRGRLFLHRGARAARHLFRLAASLDSLVLGEDQILAQVRAAYAEARSLGLTGRILGPLFEQALQVGKRVRTRTELSRHPVSVVSLGAAFLAERLRHRSTAPLIAVLGAGATGAHAARALAALGLPVTFVANRTPERAARLAHEVGARPLALAALCAGHEPLDALVSATSAPGYVLDAAALARLAARAPGGTLVAVDLALPRDLEPCADARIERVDLDALRSQADRNRAMRAGAALEAEALIEEQLAVMLRGQDVERVAGSYAGVIERTREAFEVELARLTRGRLAHLDARDRASVERWARAAFGRLAHVPWSALKRLARQDGLPRAEWEGLE